MKHQSRQGSQPERYLISLGILFQLDDKRKAWSLTLKQSCVLRVCSVISSPFGTPWTVAHQAPLSMGFFHTIFKTKSSLPYSHENQ